MAPARQTLPRPSAAGPAPRFAASCPQTPARPHPPSERARQPRMSAPSGRRLSAFSAESDGLPLPCVVRAPPQPQRCTGAAGFPSISTSSGVVAGPPASNALATICGSAVPAATTVSQLTERCGIATLHARRGIRQLIGELALARLLWLRIPCITKGIPGLTTNVGIRGRGKLQQDRSRHGRQESRVFVFVAA